MSRARHLRELDNVECPRCESVLTRCRGGGRADTGERLRRRVCQECAQIFTTVEVAVLYADGEVVPISALDSEIRAMNRRNQRARIGYHGTMSGRRPYAESSRLTVRVVASRPRREEQAA